MLLGDVLAVEAPPVEITGLAYDNRTVEEGTLFFCVPGFTRDGHDFAPDAIARGAAALVVDHALGLGVPEVVVDDVRAAMAPAAARFHGDPTARLRMAGVTGTNGKTTTCFLVRELLEAAGIQTGLLGTVTSFVGGEERPTVRTTPEAIDLQCTFAEMLDGGDARVRDGGLLARARAAPRRRDPLGRRGLHEPDPGPPRLPPDDGGLLPRQAAAVRGRPDAVKVINVDDEYGRRLAAELPATRSRYSLGDVEDLERRLHRLALHASRGRELRDAAPGRVQRAQRARGDPRRARARRRRRRDRRGRCRAPAACPGRFEPVDEGQDFAVIVDYSHTPDSLENVLRAARDLAPTGACICVFGCGGDRDRGEAAADGPDRRRRSPTSPIVTSDNPRSEDPQAIIDEIAAAMADDASHRGRPARRRSREAIGQAGAATSSSSPARATSRARSSRTAARSRSTTSTVAREVLRGARVDA